MWPQAGDCVLVSVSGAIEIVINVSIILDAKQNFLLPLGYTPRLSTQVTSVNFSLLFNASGKE